MSDIANLIPTGPELLAAVEALQAKFGHDEMAEVRVGVARYSNSRRWRISYDAYHGHRGWSANNETLADAFEKLEPTETEASALRERARELLRQAEAAEARLKGGAQ